VLSENCKKRLHGVTNIKNFPVRSAFALVVNGHPIYGGWLLSRYVSNYYACDWIYITLFDENDEGKLRIDLRYPRHKAADKFNEDARDNKSLMDRLNASGRLKTN